MKRLTAELKAERAEGERVQILEPVAVTVTPIAPGCGMPIVGWLIFMSLGVQVAGD